MGAYKLPEYNWGRLTFEISGTYYLHYNSQNPDGTWSGNIGTTFGTGGAGILGVIPRWKHYATLTWDRVRGRRRSGSRSRVPIPTTTGSSSPGDPRTVGSHVPLGSERNLHRHQEHEADAGCEEPVRYQPASHRTRRALSSLASTRRITTRAPGSSTAPSTTSSSKRHPSRCHRGELRLPVFFALSPSTLPLRSFRLDLPRPAVSSYPAHVIQFPLP